MKFIQKILLAPFSLIYVGITAIRNLLFDKGLFKSQKSKHFSIGVGNLSVGGSGKSPFIKYLAQLDIFENPAILSRGYGRRTKGFLEVNGESTAEQVGDEPKMLSQYANAFVCEKRVIGDVKIPMKHDVLLLDDVFQHRHLKANVNILITEFDRLFSSDWPLPSGRLRELRSGAKRADVIIVSKVPHDKSSHFKQKIEAIRRYNSTAQVFFCEYLNAEPINNHGQKLRKKEKVVCFAGLASHEPFRKFCFENYKMADFYSFGDHHTYTQENLKTLFKNSYDLKFITTAKDYVKIKDICAPGELDRIFYTDTSVEFVNDEEIFKNIVKNAYQAFHRQ